MMYKVNYQYPATTGRLQGTVRSGTVAIEAKTPEEAKVKAKALTKAYGHEHAVIGHPMQWLPDA